MHDYGYFSSEEIKYNSTVRFDDVMRQIVFMNKVRIHYEVPIIPTSWTREGENQASLVAQGKSFTTSQHVLGDATDTQSLNHVEPENLIPTAILYGAKGIGVYFKDGKVYHYHLDTRVTNVNERGFNLWYIDIQEDGKFEDMVVPANVFELANNAFKITQINGGTINVR